MPTNIDTNITTAPFPFPTDNVLSKTNDIVEPIVVPQEKTIQRTSDFIQENTDNIISIFPKKLESSGYVILSVVTLILSLALFLFAKRLQKLVTAAKDITVSLYSQQQVIEYRLLLSELNNAHSTIEKTNVRTQLYNFLNIICLEICSTKDSYLALQLATAFFTKIQTRYVKLSPLPDGIIYFKHVGRILTNNTNDIINEKLLLQKIQVDFKDLQNKKNRIINKKMERNPTPPTDSTKKNTWFSANKNK